MNSVVAIGKVQLFVFAKNYIAYEIAKHSGLNNDNAGHKQGKTK